MSAQAMLSLAFDLNIQPGEIPSTIYLKQESDSIYILLRIAAAGTTMETGGAAVLKATRPDGSKLFEVLAISGIDANFISVELTSQQVREMSRAPGVFEGTISIIDTDDAISQATYQAYDLITVQPFILDVQPSVSS